LIFVRSRSWRSFHSSAETLEGTLTHTIHLFNRKMVLRLRLYRPWCLTNYIFMIYLPAPHVSFIFLKNSICPW
jgi:hypothetical protein